MIVYQTPTLFSDSWYYNNLQMDPVQINIHYFINSWDPALMYDITISAGSAVLILNVFH